LGLRPKRKLYAAKTGTIYKITPGGVVSTFASGFSEPTGLAFDGSGNLYVAVFDPADFEAIFKITPAGVVSAFPTSTAVLNSGGMAFDGSGNLYVANTGGLVYKMTLPLGW